MLHLLALGHPEDLRGVEAAGVVVEHDGRAQVQAGEGGPLGGGVHQRRHREPARPGRRATAAANDSAVVCSLPPMPDTKMSAWRHSTPLGRPVVPPVHTR